jgi:hypothetical protein
VWGKGVSALIGRGRVGKGVRLDFLPIFFKARFSSRKFEPGPFSCDPAAAAVVDLGRRIRGNSSLAPFLLAFSSFEPGPVSIFRA